ncbi:HNH endonuclease [Pseudomonas aeruginosa]|uniref:Endonuclease n=1 Tax=Pseudomonas aeruginosa TaxID=287 RepID=A0A7M2ZKQ3_PSEAI|nr:HNH endonuclease [Pseudomonas aeruginosa]EKL8565176.1 HNH endonuclease [Pseudomonas aeruginosa]MBG4673371.1 HNH endonuclease [Pseudomonas aeruginosa]MBG4784659.1 HNH endonuclease [Pseudomonas aeruginosa]MBH9319472.1 HNH endonuclease [Pseudomonas aeruginosa]MBI6967994.1 HNH endonuclease [Pseudomonas aeruginosa]
MNEISQAELKQLLHYDPDSGAFRWLVDKARATAGSPAGNRSASGYLRVQINGRTYPLHRLAFLYVDGELPAEDVDHINRDREDNRFANLRRASRAQNLRNKGGYRSSTTGATGVSMRGKRYRAYINRDGRRFTLGTFDTLEAAQAAYSAAKAVLHPESSACPR